MREKRERKKKSFWRFRVGPVQLYFRVYVDIQAEPKDVLDFVIGIGFAEFIQSTRFLLLCLLPLNPYLASFFFFFFCPPLLL